MQFFILERLDAITNEVIENTKIQGCLEHIKRIIEKNPSTQYRIQATKYNNFSELDCIGCCMERTNNKTY
jgi:hypothetical protein